MCFSGNLQYKGDGENLEIVQSEDTKMVRGLDHMMQEQMIGSWDFSELGCLVKMRLSYDLYVSPQ